MILRLTSGLILALALASTSCSELEEAYDCVYVCDEYAACYDNDYDVSECTTTCEDSADASEIFALQVNNCQACIDGKACTATFECTAECAGIVP